MIYRVTFSGYCIVHADSPEEAFDIAQDGYPIDEEWTEYEDVEEITE